MVMFHPEIPYSEALRRGAVQVRILDEVDAVAYATGGLDLSMAEHLITDRLPPI